MPDYTGLRITPTHTAEAKAKNQRIAANLLRLRRALERHFYSEASSTAAASAPDSSDAVQPMAAAARVASEQPTRHRPVADETMILRLATWNIREFDSNTYGKRLDESFYYIAEVLAHFDLIAVQEIREDRQALEEVMQLLGSNWRYISSDVTEGAKGNRERMVFIYNTTKVQFHKVAGEVVLPEENAGETLLMESPTTIHVPDQERLTLRDNVGTYTWRHLERLSDEVRVRLPNGTMLQLPEGTRLVLPRRTDIERDEEGKPFVPVDKPLTDMLLQIPPKTLVAEKLVFARSPFLVVFRAGWLSLALCTVHIYYGEGELGLRRRKAEIYRLVEFLAERAATENDTDANNFFIALGDFNIVDRQHETMQSLERHDFLVPDQLKTLPGSNVEKDKYYDQIAYWTKSRPITDLQDSVTRVEVLRANIFDFFEVVYRSCEEGTDPQDECWQDMNHYVENVTSLRREVHEAIERKEERGPLTDAEKQEVTRDVYRQWRTYQMSDHLPMWIELRIDFGEDFLNAIVEQ